MNYSMSGSKITQSGSTVRESRKRNAVQQRLRTEIALDVLTLLHRTFSEDDAIEYLAEELEVAQSTVLSWKRGRYRPRGINLVRLVEVFNDLAKGSLDYTYACHVEDERSKPGIKRYKLQRVRHQGVKGKIVPIYPEHAKAVYMPKKDKRVDEEQKQAEALKAANATFDTRVRLNDWASGFIVGLSVGLLGSLITYVVLHLPG